MDYLDPKKKRNHKIRISIGYGLFAVAIGFATLILVYIANGYYIDTSTGEVIQNGLVFVDTKPTDGDLYLNGELQRGKTDARLVIPSGTYKIDVEKEGYRQWSRSIRLEGGTLRKLTYARLIPNELTQAPAVNLRSDAASVSQSIDKRWLVVSHADTPLAMSLIDVDQAILTTSPLTIPDAVVAEPTAGLIEVIEWTSDNRFFLASYTTPTTTEYLLIDRENPQLATNLTTTLQLDTLELGLRDRNRARFFAYDNASKNLLTVDTATGVNPVPYLENVLAYKVFANDWVLYITESGKEGLVEARFRRGEKDILLKEVKTAETYLLQLARLGNAPVMAISSPVEDRAVIYNDPEGYLNNNPDAAIPVATTVLRVANPIDLTISSDASVVLAYGPENIASHEFEADRSYNFETGLTIDGEDAITWVDGQHIQFRSAGTQYISDFDGSNIYELAPAHPTLPYFFNNDVTIAYSLVTAASDTEGALTRQANVSRMDLLTEADR